MLEPDGNFIRIPRRKFFTFTDIHFECPQIFVVKSPPDISTDRTTSGPGRIQEIN